MHQSHPYVERNIEQQKPPTPKMFIFWQKFFKFKKNSFYWKKSNRCKVCSKYITIDSNG